MKWLLTIFARFSDVLLDDEAGLERDRKASVKRRQGGRSVPGSDRVVRRRRRDEISDWDW